jgi:hypothetical protein
MDNNFLQRYESLKRPFKKETLDFLDSIEDPDVIDSDFLLADLQEQFTEDLRLDDYFKNFF